MQRKRNPSTWDRWTDPRDPGVRALVWLVIGLCLLWIMPGALCFLALTLPLLLFVRPG